MINAINTTEVREIALKQGDWYDRVTYATSFRGEFNADTIAAALSAHYTRKARGQYNEVANVELAAPGYITFTRSFSIGD